ncbi:hypothetical protein JT05_02865 [Desulfosporosinus sp. Tol-M]|nr:hypothetical protein JT05_02865 [Desulfosporosinus sp. Tol-M]
MEPRPRTHKRQLLILCGPSQMRNIVPLLRDGIRRQHSTICLNEPIRTYTAAAVYKKKRKGHSSRPQTKPEWP